MNVLSTTLLNIVLIISGFLYGGNSKVNDDGVPFKIVIDNILVVIKVIIILNSITKTNIKPTLSPRGGN